MKEFTLGKSPLNVNGVASLLAEQDSLRFMKEFMLGKRDINAHSVASALADQET